jgi:hypothetical protein
MSESFSTTHYLGDPAKASNRQFASTSPGYEGGENIAGSEPLSAPALYIAPSFQGQSGQPNNQSISRPRGST